MKRQRKGFTLVELAIVIAILGILAVVAIPKYQGMVEDARSSAAKAQLGTVRSAIGIYYAKNKGTWPTLAVLSATTNNLLFVEGTIPTVEITDVNGTVIRSAAVAADATPSTAITGSDFTNAGGWVYNSSTGEVRINSTATDPAANPSAAWSSY
jgi:prepilin-type N-terminal cleavage/methylation domain-containing protein